MWKVALLQFKKISVRVLEIAIFKTTWHNRHPHSCKRRFFYQTFVVFATNDIKYGF